MLLFALAMLLPAQDLFPLATGNQWMFRSNRFGQTLAIEVGDAREWDGASYFAVTGLSHPGAKRWLRRTDDGAILEFLEDQKKTRPFLALQSEIDQRFEANVDECSRAAAISTRSAKLQLAAAGGGEFQTGVEVRYLDSICADAGLLKDTFLPDVGLVRREESSFAGPVVYDLVYARVNGYLTLAQPESGFGLSVSTAGARVLARLTVRNGGSAPLQLRFTSGQRYNVEITDAATGKAVYNWAADKQFLQAAETVAVDREKNWVVDFDPRLPEGSYIVEAYLTTSQAGELPFRARTPLTVVAPAPAAVQ